MEWDPLCGSHDQLVATQSSLRHLLHYSIANIYQLNDYQEKFSIEPFLLNISELVFIISGFAFSVMAA